MFYKYFYKRVRNGHNRGKFLEIYIFMEKSDFEHQTYLSTTKSIWKFVRQFPKSHPDVNVNGRFNNIRALFWHSSLPSEMLSPRHYIKYTHIQKNMMHSMLIPISRIKVKINNSSKINNQSVCGVIYVKFLAGPVISNTDAVIDDNTFEECPAIKLANKIDATILDNAPVDKDVKTNRSNIFSYICDNFDLYKNNFIKMQ